MVEAIKIWNEPNNLSHWDFTIDKKWQEFSRMAHLAAASIKQLCPWLTVVLGGISPIDPDFIKLLSSYGLLQHFDAIAVHGFPLDWNHWQIQEWPSKISAIEKVCKLPIWVTEVGASTFGADEIQVFGLKKTKELLLGRVPRIYWYSLLDLPANWEATTRHKESEGSSYYRHFYMGLIRADGTVKPALSEFDPELGVCQWFHYQDPRLEFACQWLKKMNVKKVRTGISWADWYRPNSLEWFDRQMDILSDFDLTITLCFTPPSVGKVASVTSPPEDLSEFANFAGDVVKRYAVKTNI
jgi:beta-xylosidase